MSKPLDAIPAKRPLGTSQRRSRDAGFSLIELMIVTSLTAIAMLAMLSIWKASQRSLQNVSAAASLAQVSSAYETYIRTSRADLTSVSATVPHVVKLALLRKAGLENSVSDKNSYGQTYELKLLQPKTGYFEAMVTTEDGVAMSNDDVIEVAQMAVARGAAAGYSSTLRPASDPRGCQGDPAAYSRGAFGDWCYPLAHFDMHAGAGHVQSILFIDTAEPGNNYDDALRRSAVNGAPELNRMRTSIDLGENDLKGTRSIVFGKSDSSITAGTSGLMTFASKGHDRMLLDSKGRLELKTGSSIDAPAGGKVLGIAGNWLSGDSQGITLQTASKNGTLTIQGPGNNHGHLAVNGNVLAKGSVAAETISANASITSGLVESRGAMTAAGRLRTGEYLQAEGRAKAGDACKPDGLIALDAARRSLVHCMAGLWASMAGPERKISLVYGTPSRLGYHHSEAVCPPGTTVVSGGFKPLNPTKPEHFKAPTQNYLNLDRNSAVLGSGVAGYVAIAACL